MAEVPKVVKPVAAVAAAKPIFMKTVHGRMVDLTTGIEYTQAPKEVIRVNGWLQSQVDAGKMVLV